MTVSEMIEILEDFDPSMEIRYSANGEFAWPIREGDFYVELVNEDSNEVLESYDEELDNVTNMVVIM